MDISKLNKFAMKHSERLQKNNLPDYDKEKQILHATVKLNEEVGELCDVVLKSIGTQRREKNKHFKAEQLGEEVADVFFTAAILASLLDVELESALEAKMTKIDARYSDNGEEVV